MEQRRALKSEVRDERGKEKLFRVAISETWVEKVDRTILATNGPAVQEVARTSLEGAEETLE